MATKKKLQWQCDITKEQLDYETDKLWELEKLYGKALDDCNAIVQKLQDRVDNGHLTPSLLNQLNYQNALKKQIETIYNDMYGTVYNSVADYIKQSYEDGILQTMYSLHSQGLDIVIPIDQNEIALMASKSPYKAFKLSQNLYGNVYEMARMAKDEITRGLINQLSYYDIARNLKNRSQQSLNRTLRIARTEAHRVNQQSKMESMSKAKDKGADIVKQWDSTLDGRTRSTHRELDGQVREIDGKFKSNKGEAYYPGAFGIASEDINCRCTVLEIPRWALDGSDEVTKYAKKDPNDPNKYSGWEDNQTQGLLKNQTEIDLWKSVNDFPTEKGNKYNQFKKAYKKKAKDAANGAKTPKLSKEDQKKIKDYEDLISDYESEIDKIEMMGLSNYDDTQLYENIWKNPVTLKDWKDKKDKIPMKSSYLIDMMDEALVNGDKAKFNKFENLLYLLDDFNTAGEDYWYYKDQIDDFQHKIDDLKLKIDMIKNPLPYKAMSPSGGSLDLNCFYKNLFNSADDADVYFRKWADQTTYSLGDDLGQTALYQYTAGSGFMNRPLSGYKKNMTGWDNGWERYNFVGFGKVDWNNENSRGKLYIEALTKLIDDTAPLSEGVVLRRGSREDGLIGLFEGAGFDYDTIKQAVEDGSIVNFEGSVVKNHAFTSTGIADGAGFGGNIDYVIKCPAGTKMVYAEPQSYFGDTISGGELYKPGMSYRSVGYEAEMLIQRGTSYRIDKITKTGYKRYKIEMTVIDQNYK